MKIQAMKMTPLRFGETPQKITVDARGKLVIPNHVVIPAIAGDGIGPEIMPQGMRITEAAVRLTNGDTRSITWLPLEIGTKALNAGKKLIPEEVMETLKQHFVFVKGPVDTPSGGGFRSVNVDLRKRMDLFACVRPVKSIPGVVTPMKVDKTDIVLFRENTEDVYQGIEFAKGSPLAKLLIWILNAVFPVVNLIMNTIKGTDNHYVAGVREDSGIGIKPISESASKRIIRAAIQYAIDHDRPSVTLVGKGNIMKYTEGAFREWGREVAQQEFPERTILFDDFKKVYKNDYAAARKDKKIIIQELHTDAMFEAAIKKPENHSVVVTMNLNGDYLSDALAATVGGLGVTPGANIGDRYAMFESVHGSAPDIAGQNKANPTALFFTMAMMLEHIGWKPAADLLRKGVEKTLASGKLTGDLAREAKQDPAKALSTSAFTDAVIETMTQEAALGKSSAA
jgi:isocitrate dehydrogenase